MKVGWFEDLTYTMPNSMIFMSAPVKTRPHGTRRVELLTLSVLSSSSGGYESYALHRLTT